MRIGWCILRTSGARTLNLCSSLSRAGFEVWTPTETKKVRPTRGRKTRVRRSAPITPTFVFARSHHAAELLALSNSYLREHPSFSLFRQADRIPIIHDGELDSLRNIEAELIERARRIEAKEKRQRFEPGQRVTVSGKAWGGMTGIVQDGDGRRARVNFGGNFTVKIDTWLLVAEIVEAAQPGATGIAA